MKEMKKIGLVLLATVAFGLTTKAQSLEWAESMGGSSFDGGLDIVSDAAGNVYTTGYFTGTVDFDPGAGIHNLTAVNNNDIFIQKLDPSGNLIWAKSIGGNAEDSGQSITLDPSGNVLISGKYLGTVDFNPSAGISNLHAPGLVYNTFILKLSASGTFIWAKNIKATNTSITTDASGNVYTAGSFAGTVDFNPAPGSASNMTSVGLVSDYILKLNPSGNFITAISGQGSGGKSIDDITINSAGNLCAVGVFSGTVDFDPSAGAANASSLGGGGDVYIMELSPSLTFNWVKQMPSPASGLRIANGIATDALNNIYICGTYSWRIDIDPGAGIHVLAGGSGFNAFAAKFDVSGNLLWGKSISGLGTERANSIDYNSNGDVYVIGEFDNTVDFDPGAGTSYASTLGGSDLFIASFDSAGDFIEVRTMGGAGHDLGQGIDINPLDDIYSTGEFFHTVDFNPGASTSYLSSAGSGDIFVQKLSNIPIEKCITLDGNNDYLVSQTNAFNSLGTTDFTFEATIKGNDSDQGNHPMIFSNGSVSLFFHNIWGGSFTKMLCLQLGGANYILMNNGSFNANILDGKCHHVAVSKEHSRLTFYVDGQPIGVREIIGNPTIAGGDLNIGKHSSNKYFFDGNISQVKIWKGARTQTEIATDANVSIPNHTDLFAYFELNDGSGQIADNNIDSYDARLGSTNSADSNDPLWTEGCCDGEDLSRLASKSESRSENSLVVGDDIFPPNWDNLERNIEIKQNLEVYPNPTNGVFNVKIENSENSVIEVVNALGKTILIQNVNSNISNIDLTSQPKGVYFVKVVSGEVLEVKRVIKN